MPKKACAAGSWLAPRPPQFGGLLLHFDFMTCAVSDLGCQHKHFEPRNPVIGRPRPRNWVLAPFHPPWPLLNLRVAPFGLMLLTVAMLEEKMRYILTLALFFTCLSAASAADPLTKRSNDASLRKTQHVRFPPVAPLPVVKPLPED